MANLIFLFFTDWLIRSTAMGKVGRRTSSKWNSFKCDQKSKQIKELADRSRFDQRLRIQQNQTETELADHVLLRYNQSHIFTVLPQLVD